MDALLQKESSIIRSKQNKQMSYSKKEEIPPAVNEKIQAVTEHYLKSQEKTDITALQENETVSHISKVTSGFIHNIIYIPFRKKQKLNLMLFGISEDEDVLDVFCSRFRTFLLLRTPYRFF